jgi:hypothetical protein
MRKLSFFLLTFFLVIAGIFLIGGCSALQDENYKSKDDQTLFKKNGISQSVITDGYY